MSHEPFWVTKMPPLLHVKMPKLMHPQEVMLIDEHFHISQYERRDT